VRALGELPAPSAPEPGSSARIAIAVLVAGAAIWLGLEQNRPTGIRPLAGGLYRLAAHGGVPLAAVGLAEFARRRASAVAIPGAIVLLAAVAARFTAAGLNALKAHPGAFALVVVIGAALSIASLSRTPGVREQWGISFGDVPWWGRRVGICLAILVPLAAIATVASPELAATYPHYKPARTHLDQLALNQLGVLVDFIGWEYLFRGYLLFAALRRGDAVLAILLPALPFFILHEGRPQVELIASLPGAMIAAWFCLRARTFAPLVILHWAMNTTVAVTAFVLRAKGG
jgi:membrane protease YdiL (CAAX protease family)